MSYVPPHLRRAAGATSLSQKFWPLADIDNALPGVGSHTFVLGYDEDEERAGRIVRIMHHVGSHVPNTSLPIGQLELWTRNHHKLLQETIGTRLPLFVESATYDGARGMRGKDSRKLYEFTGWHVLDSVTILGPGSAETEAFLKKRNEGQRRRTKDPARLKELEEREKIAARDPWACVRVRKCDEEVQQALGSPVQKWADNGRVPRPRRPVEDRQKEQPEGGVAIQEAVTSTTAVSKPAPASGEEQDSLANKTDRLAIHD